ncbi:hypothetical protein [Azospirillum sp. sgz301742]
MRYTPVRRDFVFDEKCRREPPCSHPLTSNVAIILRDEEGRELPFGPTCAKNALDEEGQRQLRLIPDFTKAAPGERKPGTGRGGGGNSGGSTQVDLEEQRYCRAVTYLLLRQERLIHVPSAGYKPFVEYLAHFRQTGELAGPMIDHILNVAASQDGTKYGFGNLQALYAYDCCIKRTLRSVRPERQKTLLDLREKLHKWLHFTQPQAQAVENWFNKIPGHQPLDPSGFSWAWRKSPCPS